ncbi:hypothetical protein FLONG3_2859 [Fusarium longipes]|uniref:CBM-cenC domain-containing protein n=1 Tax=Fusarium longipes TaxID=694270 RepID=A0A395T2I3_9HYPO|nr:hypothetical protein FLONG3_2859 [Fusarium longipes]
MFRVGALQLLAICQLSFASPCKPVSSSNTITLLTTISTETTFLPTATSFTDVLSTDVSLTDSPFTTDALSTDVSSSADTSATGASSTDTSSSMDASSTYASSTYASSSDISSTETFATFTSESTVVSETETTTSDAFTTSIAETDTSTTLDMTTSSIEPTTTTTLFVEPTNVLANPDFESAAVSPWHRIGSFGEVTLIDEEPHSGLYSGHYSASLNDPVVLGVDHPIDFGLIKVDQEYTYSIWIKTTVAVNCRTRHITCGSGGGHFKREEWAGPYNEWTQFTMSCTWSQYFHDLGPSIQIRGECQSLEFDVDDAIVIEAS